MKYIFYFLIFVSLTAQEPPVIPRRTSIEVNNRIIDVHNHDNHVIINMDNAHAQQEINNWQTFIKKHKKELTEGGVVAGSVLTAITTLIIHFTQECDK